MLSRRELVTGASLMLTPFPTAGAEAIRHYVPYGTDYSRNGYNAYARMFGAEEPGTSFRHGVDYDASFTVDPDRFPDRSEARWTAPAGQSPAGVWGYIHIDRVDAPPTQVTKISASVTTFDYSHSGTSHFNLLIEDWLARSASPPVWGDDPNTVWEVGFFLHCHDYRFHNSGSWIGLHMNNGVVYTCTRNSRFITFAPASRRAVLTGAIDRRAAYAFLISRGLMTGEEWLSGPIGLTGVEPTSAPQAEGSQSGSVRFNRIATSLDVDPNRKPDRTDLTSGLRSGDFPPPWSSWLVSRTLDVGRMPPAI